MAIGDSKATRRYAHALFNVALERNEVDDVARNLETITQTVTASPELMTVLHHPRINNARRKDILRRVFQGSVRQDVENFLFLLIEKDRANIIPDIAREFARLVDVHRGAADALAISAVELTAQQQEALNAQLRAQMGLNTIRLQTRVDPSILGGLVVRVGDKLFDGSAYTQLQQIREQMKQTKVI
jgi:F-type H+-transporting ATPase subunit delta